VAFKRYGLAPKLQRRQVEGLGEDDSVARVDQVAGGEEGAAPLGEILRLATIERSDRQPEGYADGDARVVQEVASVGEEHRETMGRLPGLGIESGHGRGRPALRGDLVDRRGGRGCEQDGVAGAPRP